MSDHVYKIVEIVGSSAVSTGPVGLGVVRCMSVRMTPAST